MSINLNELKVGDRVRFRCGGVATVESFYGKVTITVCFDECEYVYCFNVDGKRPTSTKTTLEDIVEIIKEEPSDGIF